jgi:hypothetical protein
MTESIKTFLENFLTKEEKIARTEKQVKHAKKELEDWEYAMKVLTGEIEEEQVEI